MKGSLFNAVKNKQYSLDLPTSIIAQYIKKNRNSKGLTLEELSKGICSLSYLSKIENDKIKADKHILNLLAKKMGISIPFDDLLIDYVTIIHDLSLSYFYKRVLELKDLLESEWIIEHDNMFKLVKMINHIVSNNHEEAYHEAVEIEDSFNYLTQEAQMLFLIAYAAIKCHNHNFNEAIKLCNLVDHFDVKDDRLVAMKEKTLFISKASLGLGFSAIEHYYACDHILQKYHVSDARFELKLHYMSFTSNHEPKKIKSMLDAMVYEKKPKELYNMHAYVKAVLSSVSEGPEKAKMYTRKAYRNKNDLFYYKLLLKRSELSNTPLPFTFEECPNQLKSLYLYSTYKVDSNVEKHKQFLKHTALPIARTNESHKHMAFFVQELKKCSVKQRRYKEALAYDEKGKKYETSLKIFT